MQAALTAVYKSSSVAAGIALLALTGKMLNIVKLLVAVINSQSTDRLVNGVGWCVLWVINYVNHRLCIHFSCDLTHCFTSWLLTMHLNQLVPVGPISLILDIRPARSSPSSSVVNRHLHALELYKQRRWKDKSFYVRDNKWPALLTTERHEIDCNFEAKSKIMQNSQSRVMKSHEN